MKADQGASLLHESGTPPGSEGHLAGELLQPSWLDTSHRALEHFVEAVAVGICRWAIDGRILDANERFLSTIGYSREELNAGLVRWSDITPPEHRERDREAEEELRLTGRNKPYEKAYIRKDGTRVPVLLSAVLTDARTMQGLAFVLDLTEQKQLSRADAEREAMLLENERLYREAREANRRKDDFITILSHELRTPLNAVLGWLTMLKRDLLDPEQRNRAVEIIERNVRIQAQLLTDLLDISRLSRGRMTLARAEVDVGALVRTVLETMRPAAVEKAIALDASLGEAHGTVIGDPIRLQQIVWNLVSNALKFTPPGGRVDVHGTASGPWMEITVTDSGVGISPEFLPFIFDRFRQEPTAASPAEAGVGLGLPIVKHLVELHGGTVRAASPGRGLGATFTVRLPAVDSGGPVRLVQNG